MPQPESVPMFGLPAEHIPAHPRCEHWACHLRWLLMVMDPDDSSLAFVAGVLVHALNRGGISEKQALAIKRVMSRMDARAADGDLGDYNLTFENADPPIGRALETMDTEGSA